VVASYGALGFCFASPTVVVPTTQAGGTQVGVSVGTTGTLGTQWQFPTVNVFWNAGNIANAPVGAEQLTSSSVIKCIDCHTALTGINGPHGSSVANYGLDANYPADYGYARLTKWIVTNPSGIDVLSTLDTISVSATSGLISADAQHPAMIGQVAAYGQASAQGRVICQKCHSLENGNSGTTYNNGQLPWETVGSGVATTTNTGYINTSWVGASNTPHSSHHQDTGTMNVDGSPQCVNCHIGLPHGWKRPRLLLDTDQDVAPYASADQLGTTQTNRTGLGTATPVIGQPDAAGVVHPGYNGEGMQSLSAVDQHTLVNGAAIWTETSCEACGFGSHHGVDFTGQANDHGIRVN